MKNKTYWNWILLLEIFFLIFITSFFPESWGQVILEAINGYLLLGLVFTFLIGLMIQFDPLSFNFGRTETPLHDSMYFGFVTFATLGYGDLLPVKPYAKSLSILIGVCGQLYLAIIIALLVGKVSSQTK
jgi:magnesium-transporting ATPase (P-type)